MDATRSNTPNSQPDAAAGMLPDKHHYASITAGERAYQRLEAGDRDKLLAAVNKRNQFAGLHNGTAGYAAKMIGKGFRFVTIANDSGLMAMAARAAVAQTRKEAGEVAAR